MRNEAKMAPGVTLSDVERCVWRLTGWRDEDWVSELMAVVEAYGLNERANAGRNVTQAILPGVGGFRVGNSPVGSGMGVRGAERPLDPGSAELLAALVSGEGQGGPDKAAGSPRQGQGDPGEDCGNPGDSAGVGRSKECSKCGERKPLRLFWKSAKASDGHMGVCGVCKAAARRRGGSGGGKRAGEVVTASER